MHAQNKDRPSPEWIAATRRRYQVEREIDRALTYKLDQRPTANCRWKRWSRASNL